MNLKSITGRSLLMAALIALPAASFAATKANVGAREDRQTLELMKNLDSAASDASDAASVLESATFSSTVTWEVHAEKLQALKDDVNEMGHIVARLGETGVANPDLDRATALLKEMAAGTQSAIGFLNAGQQNFWSPAYRKSIGDLANESEQLTKLLKRR